LLTTETEIIATSLLVWTRRSLTLDEAGSSPRPAVRVLLKNTHIFVAVNFGRAVGRIPVPLDPAAAAFIDSAAKAAIE
jgi:hypothetical protein